MNTMNTEGLSLKNSMKCSFIYYIKEINYHYHLYNLAELRLKLWQKLKFKKEFKSNCSRNKVKELLPLIMSFKLKCSLKFSTC